MTDRSAIVIKTMAAQKMAAQKMAAQKIVDKTSINRIERAIGY